MQRKRNLNWALQSKDGTIDIRTEVTVKAKANVLPSVVRAQYSGPKGRGTGCPRKRRHSETRGWKGTQSGKPWILWSLGIFRSSWATETPDELCLGGFFGPFTTIDDWE